MKIGNIDWQDTTLRNLGFKFDENDGKYKKGFSYLFCTINSWNGVITIIPINQKCINYEVYTKEIINLGVMFDTHFSIKEDVEDEK